MVGRENMQHHRRRYLIAIGACNVIILHRNSRELHLLSVTDVACIILAVSTVANDNESYYNICSIYIRRLRRRYNSQYSMYIPSRETIFLVLEHNREFFFFPVRTWRHYLNWNYFSHYGATEEKIFCYSDLTFIIYVWEGGGGRAVA